jgi:P-type conjugative transfer protein TrbJ
MSLVCSLLLVLSLVFLPSRSVALWGVGDIVHDPIQNATNGLTALRALQSNYHEVEQIKHQITSLANEAKQLAQLPVSVVQEIQQAMTQYNALMGQGRMAYWQARGALDTFTRLFTAGNIPLTQRATAIWEQIQATGGLAAQLQGVYEQATTTTQRVARVGQASKAAVGGLQAQQAGNELLVTLAQQQNTLVLLQATTQRLQTEMAMYQVAVEQDARRNAQRWGTGWVQRPVRGPGEGQGPLLP